MKNKNIFTYQKGIVLNKELGKLISYSFDLHESDFNRDCKIPTLQFGDIGSSIRYGKKTDNGGIYGWRIYENHSSDILLTQIGVFKKGPNSTTSYFLQTDNLDYDTYSTKTKLDNNGQYFIYDGNKRNVTSEEFIEAMVMLGYNKEDVIAVTENKMTAKEAFQKVAPDYLKNIDWVNINRKKYVFDGNVAISGDFYGVIIDNFPFPFDGQPILDCSKVNTQYILFKDNKRNAKLCNVNVNKDSIKYTDLRTAKIDEAIDLSMVDASGTIFGTQVVLNPQSSIAPLNTMNLTLAMDRDGKNYVTDINGHIIDEKNSETREILISDKVKQITVYANADNEKMAQIALEKGADGIGLVRTENIFSECESGILKKFITYYNYENKEALDILRELTKKQVENILLLAKEKRIIVRLLDFKFKEFLKISHTTLDDLDLKELPDTRGTKGIDHNLLSTQLEALMELTTKYNIELNILLPMINNINDFEYIKKEILNQAKNSNIKNIRIGAMIENIHSLNYADVLAKNADFISIGTNDLTENLTGFSRDSQRREFQILSDQVKLAIHEIIYKVRSVKPNIEIGICGEHNNYIENIDFLSTLNIDYITCAPAYVMATKNALTFQSTEMIRQRRIGQSK